MQPSERLATPTPEDFAFSRLISYACLQWPGYRDAAHHRLICRKLEAVERGEIDRLIISMPPRHGKSMLASEFFPAWYLGRNPDHYVCAATYAQDLADDFGRKVRDQMADPLFQTVFPGVGLKGDSASVKRFHVSAIEPGTDRAEGGYEYSTRQAGAYYAVGVGGPLTGRGAHLLLIDDPIKNREDADSEIVRRKIKDWYTSTAYTRLMPQGRIVLIQTRWNEDDLAGWLTKEHAHEQWDVLSLPAISPEGLPLWPDQYDINALKRIERALPARDWSALYQQRPQPDEGGYFQRAWFKRWAQKPPLQIYGSSDYAVTDGGGDFTVHYVWGVAPDGSIYFVDRWKGQASADVWISAQLDLVAKWKPIAWFGEAGPIRRAIEPLMARMSQERRVYVRQEFIPSMRDKPTRARGLQARMSTGKVYWPNETWVDELMHDFLTFPAGKHDDDIDAAALPGLVLDQAHPAIVAVNTAKKPRDMWDSDEEERDSWRTA